MASRGKEKGNRAQRVARDLVEKWTNKKFKSTSSDSIAGGVGWNREPHKGDLKCDTEGHFFPFSVEVKHYAEIDFAHLLVPDIKNIAILEFWKQCSEDAKLQNKVPILMMRYDRLPADFFFVVITQPFAKLIHEELTYSFEDIKSLRFHDYKTDDPIMILQSNQFFATDYKVVKKIAKLHIKSLYK